ncbi:MAG TPA: TetR family transcriptional regulator [bacterium]|nr:TetR family transcriptional regulator [bacterium]
MNKTQTEKVQKAEKTKQKILEASLDLFLKYGYEKTTMRAIAKELGLAPGAAYYHFEAKEHIIQAFYEKSFEEHLPGVEKVLAKEKELKKLVAGVTRAHLMIAEKYHAISKALFTTAGDPDHVLSPFSAQSKPLRDRNIEIYKRVLETTTSTIPANLRDKLPEMLWMYKMGIILYWIYDKSPRQKKTFQLIDQSSVLIGRLVQLSNLPVLRGFSGQIVKMFYWYKFY